MTCKEFSRRHRAFAFGLKLEEVDAALACRRTRSILGLALLPPSRRQRPLRWREVVTTRPERLLRSGHGS